MNLHSINSLFGCFLSNVTLCSSLHLQLLDSSESLCIEAFDLAWKIISSLSNTQLIFWANLKAFVQFIFDTEVLAVAASAKGQAYAKIREVSFKNSFFFLRREHKFCLDVKMYFIFYFLFSYFCEFFISEKVHV